MAIGDKIPVGAIRKALAENPVLKWAVIGVVIIFAVEFLAKEAPGLIKVYATLPGEIAATNAENCNKEMHVMVQSGRYNKTVKSQEYKAWFDRCSQYYGEQKQEQPTSKLQNEKLQQETEQDKYERLRKEFAEEQLSKVWAQEEPLKIEKDSCERIKDGGNNMYISNRLHTACISSVIIWNLNKQNDIRNACYELSADINEFVGRAKEQLAALWKKECPQETKAE